VQKNGKYLPFYEWTLVKERRLVPLLGKDSTSHTNYYYNYCYNIKNLCLIPKNTLLTRFTPYRVHGLIIKNNPFKYPEEILAMTRPFVSILIIFLVEGTAYAKG
jgi:hypothetical protein